jgi:hypothetical protein
MQIFNNLPLDEDELNFVNSSNSYREGPLFDNSLNESLKLRSKTEVQDQFN